MKIEWIPTNVGYDPDQLKEAVYELCHSLNVDIEEYEIETAHRLQSKVSPKPVIVVFLVRSCLFVTLIKCLKGQKSLGLPLEGVL